MHIHKTHNPTIPLLFHAPIQINILLEERHSLVGSPIMSHIDLPEATDYGLNLLQTLEATGLICRQYSFI